jgi:uncharacterized protein
MELAWFLALVGGAMIGLAVSLLLWANGRVAGISGIVGGLFGTTARDAGWRIAFIAGLLLTGAIGGALAPSAFAVAIDRPMVLVIAAGLIVGFGTRLANGCTSGHGVCGLSRLSIRSLIATVTFIGTGAATVFVLDHVLGGR